MEYCGEPSIDAVSQRGCELAHLAMRVAKFDELIHAQVERAVHVLAVNFSLTQCFDFIIHRA